MRGHFLLCVMVYLVGTGPTVAQDAIQDERVRIVERMESAQDRHLRAYTVSGHEFRVMDAGDEIVPQQKAVSIRPAAGNPLAFAIAPLHLPDGARIEELQIFGCTTPGFDGTLYVGVVVDCEAAQCEAADREARISANGCALTHEIVSFLPVENARKQYYLEAKATQNAGEMSLVFARVLYSLHPAPAPEIASFADVPTTHSFFRFVEALYTTGAIAGCGNGNYCPNSPVTRGQLAVILAAAFGLGW